MVLHDFECLARDTFVEQHQWCREAHKDPAMRRPPRADARLITIGMAAVKEQVDNYEHKAKLAAVRNASTAAMRTRIDCAPMSSTRLIVTMSFQGTRTTGCER